MQNRQQQVTRRAFLGMAGLALAGTLAGCGRREEFGGPELNPREAGATGPRTLDDIRVSGVCNVGIVSDNRPLSGIDGTGNYRGLDQYFCLYFTERTWIGVNYVAVDPRDRYDRLLSGEIDVCVSEMSPSDERASEVAFAHPLYQLQLGLVSPKSAPVNAVENLGQGPLVVCEGSYAEQYARATWPGVELRSYPTLSSARTALEQGKGIALLDEEISAFWWVKEHGGYTLGVKAIGEPRRVAPAVAAGCDDVLAEITEVTADFIKYSWLARAYEYVVLPDVGEEYKSILCKLEGEG